jgi:4-diphosphocytidyl-2-C-methyl-D-erythritol kinase
MATFSIKAPAKVNLALHVLGRRADGYHELDSIVAFAEDGDLLTFEPADRFSLTASGPFAHRLPDMSENIIARAWAKANEIAAARGRRLPETAVHLVKNLPVASGIGGGSSDAAAALRGFLKMAGMAEIDGAIVGQSLALGADVPVCLAGKASRMRGIGEQLTPLENTGPVDVILVNPGIELSTATVFRNLGLEPGSRHGDPIIDPSDRKTWRNDLLEPAMALAPAKSSQA